MPRRRICSLRHAVAKDKLLETEGALSHHDLVEGEEQGKLEEINM
jgi:hypothetical protein